MSRVEPCDIPPVALLLRYQDGRSYADCFCIEVDRAVTQAEFVRAFYTTRLFKVERLLLGLFASRPSTDADAGRLASGEAADFAAWRVEARTDGQLLLCDFTGRTRSWLMASPLPGGATRLYFGSAVVAPEGAVPGRRGFPFDVLLRFHQLYSRLLLRAAKNGVRFTSSEPPPG
jgi:hypothetical protein